MFLHHSLYVENLETCDFIYDFLFYFHLRQAGTLADDVTGPLVYAFRVRNALPREMGGKL